MARITVEDCLENVENRFELVILAAKRARQLSRGADSLVERERDKDTVVALREIAAGHITPEVVDSIQAKTNAAKSVLGIPPEDEDL